jgi:hypothetical protein
MSIFLEIVDAEQRIGCLGLGRQGKGRQSDDGSLRLIREILPFVIAKYGISPQCLHPGRSPERISAGPSFLLSHRLEQVLTLNRGELIAC